MTSEIVVGVREDDGDELLLLVGTEEDQTLLWDNINPPPPLPPLEDDLGLCLDMESSSTLLPLPPNSSHPSVASLSIEQIEQFLLNDDHDHHRTDSHDPSDDCLYDILLDSPLPLTDDLQYPSSSSTSSYDHNNNSQSQSLSPHEIIGPQSNHPGFPFPNAPDHSSPSPDLHPTTPPISHNSLPQQQVNDSSEHPELQQPSSPLSHDSQPQPEEDSLHRHEDAGDDPITKKRKRQLRNRDAAVRSRERKKMYVRDLEIKSRHYESECRRLGMLLQCYLAENHALRLSMHNNSQAFAASTTKQESAVLLLESLLLGSLLWLVGVIGLVMVPRELLSILAAAQMGEGQSLGRRAPKEAGSKADGGEELHQSYMMSKRCRGARRKMRGIVQVVVVG